GRERLEFALERLIRSSLVSQPDAKPGQILNDVLLLGESGDDSLLREVLEKVLRELYGTRERFETRGQREPVFAAARAAALNCWKELNDPFNSLEQCDGPLAQVVNWLQPTYTNGEPS